MLTTSHITHVVSVPYDKALDLNCKVQVAEQVCQELQFYPITGWSWNFKPSPTVHQESYLIALVLWIASELDQETDTIYKAKQATPDTVK